MENPARSIFEEIADDEFPEWLAIQEQTERERASKRITELVVGVAHNSRLGKGGK